MANDEKTRCRSPEIGHGRGPFVIRISSFVILSSVELHIRHSRGPLRRNAFRARNRRPRRLALAALEQHQAIPERRVPGPWRLDIQQHAVLERALLDEIEISLAHLCPVRVVDENEAPPREKWLGQSEAVELVLVRV